MTLFATAAKGTEPALRDELREMGLAGVRADRGGVHFEGGMEEAARACLWSRIASRILAPLAVIDAPDGDALHEGLSRIDWRPYFGPASTLAVRAACKSSRLTHTQFIAQRTKDAIVDQLRSASGHRPSVDRDDPDVSVFVHIVNDRATIYLDLSGTPLHRRGYRVRQLDAPLKETLAAAIVRMSGWDRARPFADPMCGSGTLAIEAAMLAANMAPGLLRDRFGFERWASHDEAAAGRMTMLREAARGALKREVPEVLASDVSQEAVDATIANAASAGVRVQAAWRRVEDIEPLGPKGQIVTNPPYGERLKDEEGLFRAMGRSLSRLEGHRLAIITGTPRLEDAFPMRPEKRMALWNGPLECRLLLYGARPSIL